MGHANNIVSGQPIAFQTRRHPILVSPCDSSGIEHGDVRGLMLKRKARMANRRGRQAPK
jgi:hypothetical protein